MDHVVVEDDRVNNTNYISSNNITSVVPYYSYNSGLDLDDLSEESTKKGESSAK